MIQSDDPVGGPYTGNGVATTFAYGFPIAAKTEILVTLTEIATGTETTLTVDTDYTVNGVGSTDSADWDITYPVSGSAMPSTYRLVITPSIPLLQETRFANQGGFQPQNHEDAFDKLTVICQQQQAELDRCVKTTVGSTTDPDDLITDLEAAAATAAAAAATAAAVITGLSTKGDLLTFSTVNTSLAVGTNGQVLTADSAQAKGVKWATPSTFDALAPTTTQGDIIFRNATVNTRLPKGTTLQQLRMNAGATAPEWFTASTPVFSVSFTSSQQTITAAGALTLAHSLGANPALVTCVLKCQSADNSFSTGDELVMPVLQAFSGGGCGAVVTYDSTNLYVRFGNTAATYQALDKTSGAEVGLDNTKWKVIFKAFV